MNKIVLTRVDSRLIHGQVITKWIKQFPAKRIMIVDDALAKDDFMADIYAMAAPSGIKVDVVDTQQALKKLQEDDKVFLLFKTIQTCYAGLQAGISISELVIGGVPSAPGKKFISSGVFLDETDMNQLDEMEKFGVNIYVRATPEEAGVPLKKILEKR